MSSPVPHSPSLLSISTRLPLAPSHTARTRTSDGSPRGSWVPRHDDLRAVRPRRFINARTHGIRYFFASGGKRPRETAEDGQKLDISRDGGGGTENKRCRCYVGSETKSGDDGNDRFGKKLGTRSKGGAKPLIDSLVRGFLFRLMAFPSNRRAAYLWLGACASCPTMAKPRRLFLDIDTNALVSVPEMADSRSTRLGTREQPRTRSAIFPGRSVRATPAAGSAS